MSINVTDAAESIRFYVDVLGMTLRDDRPEFPFEGAWLQAGEQQIHLLQVDGFEPPQGQHFALEIDDLDAARTELNAHGVTGVDQSGVSLDAARELFASVDTAGRFVEANVYDAVAALDGEQFDLVYTGVGAINWLPDIARWGQVVGALVAPGGRFLMRDGHPMGYAIDDEQVEGGVLRLKYPYFETVEPMTFDDTATYVDTGGAELTDTVSHEWNHGIGEVFTALATVGLRVTTLVEHRGLDWEMIPGQVQIGDQWFLPEQHRDAAPLMYTIGATKPAE